MSVDPPQPSDDSHDGPSRGVEDGVDTTKGLQSDSFAASTETLHDAPTNLPKRIGHYHIKSVIASGGMGTVYQATQENPRRVVALKLMKHGIASRSALRRFEFESQILARLRHPGIAQVYEAGTHRDDSGTVPFFAMEYIVGAKPITEYAKEKKLKTRRRMELFGQVCGAIQHGHQKGIIHRDLKPSNILVDAQGRVKIIDFGVARSTDSDMAVTTLQTDIGQLIGTLQYMSPEQCEADPHNIDTRSDVYALGVLFYELLCDRLPYDVTRMAMHEATRIIREEQPAKLSTLNRTLHGDVETIALKALEKDRERRYQSASALAADIEHYLSNEAISARPPSMTYQLRVFARRHKGFFAAIAAVFVILLGATILSTAQYTRAEAARKLAVAAEQRATAEADKSEQVATFMMDMLKGVGPSVALGRDTTMLREILDDTAKRVSKDLADQPEVEATIRATLGVTYLELGEYPAAESHLRAALDLRRRYFGDEHPDTLGSISNMGSLLQAQGKPDEAEPYFREALESRRRVLGDDHPRTLISINSMRSLLQAQGKLDEAEPYYREALEGSRRVLGNDHPGTLALINNMGYLLESRGKLDEAEPYFREALEGNRRILGDDHPHTLTSIHSMGGLLVSQGKLDEAEPYYREAMEDSGRVLGDNHPDTLVLINNMGYLLNQIGRYDDAAEILLAGESAARRVWTGGNARLLGNYLAKLGEAHTGKGTLLEAEKTLLEAHGLLAAGFGDDHKRTTKTVNLLITLYESWHAAEPGWGYDVKAAEWRAGLSTQPVE